MLVISLSNRPGSQGRQVALRLAMIWLSPEQFDDECSGKDDVVSTLVASLENSISRTPSHCRNTCEEYVRLGAIPGRADGISAELQHREGSLA